MPFDGVVLVFIDLIENFPEMLKIKKRIYYEVASWLEDAEMCEEQGMYSHIVCTHNPKTKMYVMMADVTDEQALFIGLKYTLVPEPKDV